jgi:hypothetical protein
MQISLGGCQKNGEGVGLAMFRFVICFIREEINTGTPLPRLPGFGPKLFLAYVTHAAFF